MGSAGLLYRDCPSCPPLCFFIKINAGFFTVPLRVVGFLIKCFFFGLYLLFVGEEVGFAIVTNKCVQALGSILCLNFHCYVFLGGKLSNDSSHLG